jgi:hypothetical protein
MHCSNVRTDSESGLCSPLPPPIRLHEKVDVPRCMCHTKPCGLIVWSATKHLGSNSYTSGCTMSSKPSPGDNRNCDGIPSKASRQSRYLASGTKSRQGTGKVEGGPWEGKLDCVFAKPPLECFRRPLPISSVFRKETGVVSGQPLARHSMSKRPGRPRLTGMVAGGPCPPHETMHRPHLVVWRGLPP